MSTDKLMERINKLLRLARDKGATEHEADTAMQMAQAIMEENNLTLATVEAAGGNAGEEGERKKERTNKRAMYPYQRNIMAALAEINMCHVSVVQERRGNAWRRMGYQIIGRKANVAATHTMFAYLTDAINRITMEQYLKGDHTRRMARDTLSFCEGMSDKLIARLKQRHAAYLAKQAKEANESKARAQHPSAAPGNALVVVMADFAKNEEDLNNDFKMGWAPGRTAQERVAREAAYVAKQAKEKELIAEGVSPDVAYYMAHFGYTREAAESVFNKKPETEKERLAREKKEARNSDRYWRRQERMANRHDPIAYAKGKSAAEDVGLDQQVEEKKKGTPSSSPRLS